MQLIQFCLFLLTSVCVSSVIWMLDKRRIRMGVALASLVIPIAIFFIDRDNVKLRALACVVAVDLCFKLIDYARGVCVHSGDRLSLVGFFQLLIPFPIFLVCLRDRVSRTSADRTGLIGVVYGVTVFLAVFFLVQGLSYVEVMRSSFLLDHSIKFVLFGIACDAMGRTVDGVERLCGYRLRPLIDNAFFSRSIDDFWFRYNTRIHAWLESHVFVAVGGNRRPVRGLFATFFVSAVFHEVAFGIATSHWDGFQFLFFMLQAPAIVIARALRRRMRAGRLRNTVTFTLSLIWFWGSSILFLRGVNRVFPFVYATP